LKYEKWKLAKNIAKELDSHFFFLVQWTNGLYAIDETNGLDDGDRYVAKGGRTDRNDKKDIEPCIFIPHQEFKRVRKDYGIIPIVQNINDYPILKQIQKTA
jgi:hypothetical protein